MELKPIPAGTKVTYMGIPATVIHGNEPAPEWGRTEPGPIVNIRFDRDVSRRMSQQQDVYVTSLLPA
jgi:hypothetical protein